LIYVYIYILIIFRSKYILMDSSLYTQLYQLSTDAFPLSVQHTTKLSEKDILVHHNVWVTHSIWILENYKKEKATRVLVGQFFCTMGELKSSPLRKECYMGIHEILRKYYLNRPHEARSSRKRMLHEVE
jgi:hypothetical protein